MPITLQKGGNLNLTKTVPNLKLVQIGLGWDARATSGEAFDLDASAFLLNTAEQMPCRTRLHLLRATEEPRRRRRAHRRQPHRCRRW